MGGTHMGKFKAFLKRKDIEISARRYGIDALGAMAQGLFCSLLIGTIINTVGQQFGIDYLVLSAVMPLPCPAPLWRSPSATP